MATCSKCKGRKTLLRDLCGLKMEVDCDGCKGTGETGVASCATCNDSKTTVSDLGGIGVEVDCPDCVPSLSPA